MKKALTIFLALLIAAVLGFVGYVYVKNQPLPQNEFDIVILDRTIELLSNEDQWLRSGDRNCEAGGPPFNLYCALRQASIEVSGEFRHRSAALQQVRYAIERQQPDADYAHRLMDYNNDPSTSFDDIHAVLQEARAQLQIASESI